eukprot:768459-Hanusia_phi.AAC.12
MPTACKPLKSLIIVHALKVSGVMERNRGASQDGSALPEVNPISQRGRPEPDGIAGSYSQARQEHGAGLTNELSASSQFAFRRSSVPAL